MFDEIQKIIAPRTLSSFEYMRLEELSKIYSEEEILKSIVSIYEAITK